VKLLEYFSRFLGGDYNKGKQLYVGIPPLHLDRIAFICLSDSGSDSHLLC
jgi:hypothetical protein